jgi:hypothetical protein
MNKPQKNHYVSNINHETANTKVTTKKMSKIFLCLSVLEYAVTHDSLKSTYIFCVSKAACISQF